VHPPKDAVKKPELALPVSSRLTGYLFKWSVVRYDRLFYWRHSKTTRQSKIDGPLAVEKLEATYLTKMWAVFEAAWVSFWRHRTGNLGMIKAMHLIQWAEGVQAGHKAADKR
jgi:hypothetical protein